MKAKKEILSAIKKVKKELLVAIQGKDIKSPLQKHFKKLSALLGSEEQPSNDEVVKVVGPMISFLEKEEEVPNGLFDLLTAKERHSILMLFLVQMVQVVQPQKQTQTVPLDVENGQDRNPYNNKPVGKLDKIF